jgi:hypothetical protein
MRASLTWKLRQGSSWLIVAEVIPAESASRVGCTILREFAGKARLTPRDLDVTGEVRKFSFVSDALTLHLRRLKETR